MKPTSGDMQSKIAYAMSIYTGSMLYTVQMYSRLINI